MRCKLHRRVACPNCQAAAKTVNPYNDATLWMTAAENAAIIASADTTTSWLDTSSSSGDSGSFSSSGDSGC